MKYEVGQKVETPFGKGIVTFLSNIGDDEIDSVWVSFKNVPEIEFSINVIKPYKTPHERLIEMGFEMVLDDEHFTIFEHHDLDYTIRVDKIWKGIGIHHYNDDPNYRYIYLKLSRILTDYLEWLEEEK